VYFDLPVIKERIKKILLRLGYEVRRVRPEQIGRDPYKDMRRLVTSNEYPILFDVGANRGQSIALFRAHFPLPVIHAFEPAPSTFVRLKEQTVGIPNLHLNNIALGSNCERRPLVENSQDTVSSLLPPGKDYCWGDISAQTDVNVSSLDAYCESNNIARIDVLKSDTQGFDHEVLKGAINLLGEHRIHLVYTELNFLEVYEGMARVEEIYVFLKSLGFELVSFYDLCWHNCRLGWLDALFIDPLWIGAENRK
jgi:FkbM family methyltransferase